MFPIVILIWKDFERFFFLSQFFSLFLVRCYIHNYSFLRLAMRHRITNVCQENIRQSKFSINLLQVGFLFTFSILTHIIFTNKHSLWSLNFLL